MSEIRHVEADTNNRCASFLWYCKTISLSILCPFTSLCVIVKVFVPLVRFLLKANYFLHAPLPASFTSGDAHVHQCAWNLNPLLNILADYYNNTGQSALYLPVVLNGCTISTSTTVGFGKTYNQSEKQSMWCKQCKMVCSGGGEWS